MPFNDSIKQFTVKTPVHAEEFNEVLGQLLENTKENKQAIGGIDASAEITTHNSSGNAHADIRKIANDASKPGHKHTKAEITDFPTTMNPTAHTHSVSQIIGLTHPVTSVAGRTGAVTLAKGDVGLGSVQNYGIATQAQCDAATSNNLYVTPLGLAGLKQSVVNGKQEVANAINEKKGTTLTTSNTHADYAWHIRDMKILNAQSVSFKYNIIVGFNDVGRITFDSLPVPSSSTNFVKIVVDLKIDWSRLPNTSVSSVTITNGKTSLSFNRSNPNQVRRFVYNIEDNKKNYIDVGFSSNVTIPASNVLAADITGYYYYSNI